MTVFVQAQNKVLGRSHYNAADCYEKQSDGDWIELGTDKCACVDSPNYRFSIDGSGDEKDLLYVFCKDGITDSDKDGN